MSTIRVTKSFGFETGHALYGYDGLCKNVHGHSYKLYVTVVGRPIDDQNHVKNGMVIDFKDLKKKVTNHPGLDVLNGMAYNPETKTLFVTGKRWDKIFEVKIIPAQ